MTDVTEKCEKIASTMKCNTCGGNVVFGSNKTVYGKVYGNGYLYMCSNFPKCNSYVGAHNTREPLGTTADKRTRIARNKAHEAFDALWTGIKDGKEKRMTRKYLYSALANRLGVQKDKCHIGMFNTQQCGLVVEFAASFNKFNYRKLPTISLPRHVNKIKVVKLKLDGRMCLKNHEVKFRPDLSNGVSIFECRICEELLYFEQTKS